jgi:hypothetical protein
VLHYSSFGVRSLCGLSDAIGPGGLLQLATTFPKKEKLPMVQIDQYAKFFRPLCTTIGLATLLCLQIGHVSAQKTDQLMVGMNADHDHGDGGGQPWRPDPHSRRDPSNPQPRIHPAPGPFHDKHAGEHIHDPQTMKLLVIAVDGTEPGYSAIQAFLDQLGIPYDSFLSVCRLQSPQCALPTFSTTSGNVATANYYGIVLTIGNLAYCNSSGVCQSTFSTADWAAMDSFTAQFGVRTVSYYTWPEARYGLAYAGVSVSTTATSPVNVTPASGQTTTTGTFPYLLSTAKVPVENAYMYFATTVAATGETTTPVLTATYNGSAYTVGALHTSATGQQYLALTMDNNAFLEHSMVFYYGLFNWVTKGQFLGGRKIYLSPEVDDLFIDDDLYDAAIPQYCVPAGFQNDPTFDNSSHCPLLRITGTDLGAVDSWELNLQKNAQTAKFKLTLAFNGIGTDPNGGYMPANDTLLPEASNVSSDFFWVSHTYDHENLDCYNAVPNSGVCNSATQTQSAYEITQNKSTATGEGLSPFDSASMVTPNVSGLANQNFITAAWANGLRYLVSDASKPGQTPPSANTGIPNALNAGILEVPRYATNIFYNTTVSASNAPGSEPDEYNYFYGPNGISKLPGGQPFFSTNQTYSQIIDNESQNLLYIMLRGYAFPSMFHQSNLHTFTGSTANGNTITGTTSLLMDTVQASINKFAALSNLPIVSLNEAGIGSLLWTRMGYNASKVVGSWTPAGPSGTGTTTGTIQIVISAPATITLTMPSKTTCPASGTGATVTCETYGSQKLVHIAMASGTPTYTFTSPQ